MWVDNKTFPPNEGRYRCLIDHDGFGNLIESENELFDGTDWSHFDSSRQFIRFWWADPDQYKIVHDFLDQEFSVHLKQKVPNKIQDIFENLKVGGLPKGGEVIIVSTADPNFEKYKNSFPAWLKYIGFNQLPYGIVDSNGDIFSEDCEIDMSRLLPITEGVYKPGKSMHSVQFSEEAMKEFEKSTKPGHYEEPKSKYINNPRKNWRRK